MQGIFFSFFHFWCRYAFLSRSCIEVQVPNGEVVELRPEDEGVEICLTNITQGGLEFDMAIERLLSFSLISYSKESDGLRNISIHPLVQYCVTQRLSPIEVSKWRWHMLLLICHAFPRNKYIEPRHVSCLV